MAEERMMQLSGKMFVSAARPSGELVGVFEHDNETGYFYLYAQSPQGSQRVVDSIHIFSGRPDFVENEVVVRWSIDEEVVGLFVREQLWAAFRQGEKFGGDYRSGGRPNMPETIAAMLEGSEIN